VNAARAAPAGQVPRLRDAGVRVYAAATGAGAGIQAALWRVPGCSAFLVGASFPYDEAETEELLGFRPERFASEETAIDLASTAYVHAVDARGSSPTRAIDSKGESAGVLPARRPIGVGLSASVATLAAHRGDHRVHVAVVTEDGALGRTLVLPKGSGPERRRRDGAAADALALRALLHAAGVEPDGALEDWTDRATARFFARPYWTESGRRREASELPKGSAIFPGAFDPPHAGHLAIAEEAAIASGAPTVFAICASAPHKEPLSLGELLRRAKLLKGERVLFTTGDPLYLDKARRLPGRTFVLGADAVMRMLDPRWGASIEPMFEELAGLRARFRVFGRAVDGVEVTASDAIAKVPERHRRLFVAAAGRWDVSSSELRARAKGQVAVGGR
jgi:nicotinic acid mononucleotide adenylyltransferase